MISLDVLIVYNEKIASSASSSTALFPFGPNNISYNTVYGYFLEICHQLKLNAGFTTSLDIVGPGTCQCFWIFKNKKWKKVNSPCYSSLIFDKFSPTKKGIKSRRQLLFSETSVKPFNDPDLFNLFFDKQLTYEILSEYAIPTISLDVNSLQSIGDSCRSLTNLLPLYSNPNDFTADIIMKDRFGAGGRHVYKFKSDQSTDMLAIANKNPNVSFIIQPFITSVSAPTDIRFIYLNGKIVQSYIRVAKSGEFRCNEHQGGLLTYLALTEIPPLLVAKSSLIAKILDKKCSLYALDFIISNHGNTYLLEGNTGPGLDWNVDLKTNEIEAKKLINLVVAELAVRVKTQLSYLN